MLDTLSRALVWADGHGLTVPVILGAITVLARLVWAALRPSVLRRWPGAVPVVEGAAARVAALLPDVLAALLRRRPTDPTEAERYEAERRALMADPDRAPLPRGPSRAPSAPSGQSGRATVATLVLLAAVGLGVPAAVTSCGPRPPPSGPGAVVSSWSDTARTVLSTLSWAIPSARAILNAILPEPARTIVGRALDAVAEASSRLAVAVEAYESRGGDRCAAHAAVGGVRAALVQLAQVLADNGVALGTVLERVADGAASIADALVPSCNPDAGWASTGDRTNAELRAIERSATARGVVLRRDLDGLRP